MRLKPMVSVIIFCDPLRFKLNLHAAEAGSVRMSFHTASVATGSRLVPVVHFDPVATARGSVTISLTLKIPHVPKRRIAIIKVRPVVKRGAIVLLHPAFFHL